MIASLWNSLQVHFKQNVPYVAYSFVTHTKLHVVELASANHVFIKSKMKKNPVQHAEMTTLVYLKISDLNAH